jgi:hypothetical protein
MKKWLISAKIDQILFCTFRNAMPNSDFAINILSFIKLQVALGYLLVGFSVPPGNRLA